MSSLSQKRTPEARATDSMATDRYAYREQPHEEPRSEHAILDGLRAKVPRGAMNNAGELDQFVTNVYILFKQHADSLEFVTGCTPTSNPNDVASYAAIIAPQSSRRDEFIVLATGYAMKPGDEHAYTFYNYGNDDRGSRYDMRYRGLRQRVEEIMHQRLAATAPPRQIESRSPRSQSRPRAFSSAREV